MKDNYLWNRSGEPDPEIQELEEVLGTLRYQPRPLAIPTNIRIARKRNYLPLVVAAALAFFVISAGLWFKFSRSQTSSPPKAQETQLNSTPVPPRPVLTENETATPVAQPPQENRQPNKSTVTVAKRSNRDQPRRPALTPQETAEREQVLVALRLVSSKLNFAQRKTQSGPQPNIIRNQHRIG
jgi:hypothetical protein